MPAAQPTGPVHQPSILAAVDVHHQHSVTGSSVMPVLLLARPASLLPPNLGPVLATTPYLHQLPLLPLSINSDLEADPSLPVHPLEEEGEVSEQETGIPDQDPDHQIWRAKLPIRGVILYVEWRQVPEFENATSKISVKLPSDDLLCWNLEKLNLPLTEGYPTCSTDTNGLSKDQFVKVPHSQKWYDVDSDKKDFSR